MDFRLNERIGPSPPTQLYADSVFDAATFVTSLRTEALKHRGVSHHYLVSLEFGTTSNTRNELRHFFRQYQGYSDWFQRYLSAAVAQSTSPTHRCVLQNNLNEEQGRLPPTDEAALVQHNIEPDWIRGVTHPRLYQRFLDSIDEKGSSDHHLGTAVIEWRTSLLKLCSESGFAVAIGALGLGTECVVRRVYKSLLRAIENHLDVAPAERVFFDLHAEFDDEHTEALRQIATDLAATPDGRRQLSRGMHRALELRATFFDRMYAQMSKQAVSKTAS